MDIPMTMMQVGSVLQLACDVCRSHIFVQNDGQKLRVTRHTQAALESGDHGALIADMVETLIDQRRQCHVGGCNCDEGQTHDMATPGQCARCGHSMELHYPGSEHRMRCSACEHTWVPIPGQGEDECPICAAREVKELRRQLGTAHIAAMPPPATTADGKPITSTEIERIKATFVCECGNRKDRLAAMCDECEYIDDEARHRAAERDRIKLEQRNAAKPVSLLKRVKAKIGAEHHHCHFVDGACVYAGCTRGVPYRCTVPMCGESGVCDECRKRGAR
jgi:hypothetical protein